MRVMKWAIVAFIGLGLCAAIFFVMKTDQPTRSVNAMITSLEKKVRWGGSEKSFQELQNELNKEKHKRKVISRFEVVEGIHGISVENITLTLLEYSYHYVNDSGRRQPVVTARCSIDISNFEKDVERLRGQLQSTGRQAPINIELPDKERTIVGVLDDVKDEFITFAALPNYVRPILKFAKLRMFKPEYIVLSLERNETSTEIDQFRSFSTAVFGFDERNKTYVKVLEIKTYREAESSDNQNYGYIDKSVVSWSDWINNEYRELIISTDREPLGPSAAFKNKKEVYTWVNDKELALVERIIDGNATMSRRGRLSSTAVELSLKDGELYEMNGNKPGAKITSTGGGIQKYLMSPDKQYVAYSIIAGSYKIMGLEGDGELRSVFNIGVMDLDSKKQLTVIKPQSEHEPFIYADRWISNEELILTESDGFATGLRYVYSAATNEVRLGEIEEMGL